MIKTFLLSTITMSFLLANQVDTNNSFIQQQPPLTKAQVVFQEKMKEAKSQTQYEDLSLQKYMIERNTYGWGDTIILDVRDIGEKEDTYFKKFTKNYKKISLGHLETKGIKEGLINEDDNILIVCRTGTRATLASNILKKQYGFKNVKVLKGGEELFEKDILNKISPQSLNTNKNQKRKYWV